MGNFVWKIDFVVDIILNIKDLKNINDWFNFIIFYLKIWVIGKVYINFI